MLNKNISTWRGKDTPPTQYHLWLKEDDNGNYIETLIYKGGAWVKYIESGGGSTETPESIKEKYESNPDTNAFTDNDKRIVGLLNNKNVLYDRPTVVLTATNAGYNWTAINLATNNIDNYPITIPRATETTAGVLTADDKIKLNTLNSTYEVLSNKTAISSTSTDIQYPTAKSVWELIQDIIATIPAGGLKVPLSIDLESNLPNVSTLEVGDYFFIQNMDLTEDGHTGRAWVNYQDPNNTSSPLIYYKVHDKYQTMDGVTITQLGNGAWGVNSIWLNQQITAITDDKVDKIEGKGLSTNDYTDEDKLKLQSLSVTIWRINDIIKNNPLALEFKSNVKIGDILTLDNAMLNILRIEYLEEDDEFVVNFINNNEYNTLVIYNDGTAWTGYTTFSINSIPTVPINKGGTGATTSRTACSNLKVYGFEAPNGTYPYATLDNFTVGSWFTAAATNPTNTPDEMWGIPFRVHNYQINGSTNVVQELISSDKTSFRYYNGSTWSNWFQKSLSGFRVGDFLAGEGGYIYHEKSGNTIVLNTPTNSGLSILKMNPNMQVQNIEDWIADEHSEAIQYLETKPNQQDEFFLYNTYKNMYNRMNPIYTPYIPYINEQRDFRKQANTEYNIALYRSFYNPSLLGSRGFIHDILTVDQGFKLWMGDEQENFRCWITDYDWNNGTKTLTAQYATYDNIPGTYFMITIRESQNIIEIEHSSV